MAGGPMDRSGAAAVEFAIVFPAFLFFALGLLDCGRLIWAQTTLTHAVESAARCGAIGATGCTTTAAVQTYAQSQAWGLGAATFTATAAAACAAQVTGVKVTVTMNFSFAIPWFYGWAPTGNAITLTSMACYPS